MNWKKTKEISVLFILILSGCSSEEEINIQLKTDQVEVMSDVNACDLVASVNGVEVIEDYITGNQIKLTDDKNSIECPDFTPNRLGLYSLEYVYRNKIYSFNIHVVDTTPPELMLKDTVVEVEQGNPYFSIHSLYTVQDAFDDKPLVSILGSWDIETVGEYSVQITAKDSSGNENKQEMSIKVIEKEKEIVEVEIPIYLEKENMNTQHKDNPSNAANSSSGWTDWIEETEDEVKIEINTSTEIDGVIPN